MKLRRLLRGIRRGGLPRDLILAMKERARGKDSSSTQQPGEEGVLTEEPDAPSDAVIGYPTLRESQLDREWLIPIESGQAVRTGWPHTGGAPNSITWHWSATWDLSTLAKILGGEGALRKGKASAHYGVGKTWDEGIHEYVAPENRSWHAGAGQTLRWDGRPAFEGGDWRGARVSIGIETVHIGYARDGVPAGDDWYTAYSANGKAAWKVPPWPEEQMEMMVGLGRYLVEKFPNIMPRDHHDHEAICPGYKYDNAGFPFARLLRGIYRDPTIPDVWTPFFLTIGRQSALKMLGYNIGDGGAGGDGIDGDWGRLSDGALRDFQLARGMVVNGQWTGFVSWAVYDAFQESGLDFQSIRRG